MKTVSGTARMPADLRAAAVLHKAGIFSSGSTCPSCGSGAGQGTAGKFRCPDCKRSWDPKEGSVLEGLSIRPQAILDIIRLYAADIPSAEAAQRLDITNERVRHAYACIGHAVTGLPCTNGSPAEEGNTVPPPVIFGIRSEKGRISITPVTGCRPERLFPFPLPGMQRGNILFVSRAALQYQACIIFSPGRNGTGLVRIPSRDTGEWSPIMGFRSYLSAGWEQRPVAERDNLPLYLHERVFRYNNRDRDMEEAVMGQLATAVRHEPEERHP